jgi:MoxR-like ATPase
VRSERVTRSDAEVRSRGADATTRRATLTHVLAGHAPSRPGFMIWLTGLGTCTIGAGSHGRLRIEGTAQSRRGRLEIDDPWVSAEHVRVRASFGGFLLEDSGAKNGVRVGGVRVRRHRLCDGDVLELGRTYVLYREQETRPEDGDEPGVVEATGFGAVSTLTWRWAMELKSLSRIAPTDLTVLLCGETGVGKDVLARAIHDESRRVGSMVPINCGALPEQLAEGLLFGHRRGAFSGAIADETGLLRSARQGTAFLDEIGDLPLATQPVLLRVLQDRAVMALGETRGDVIDVRFIGATNQDLDTLVERGRFRADLLARLATHRVAVPPLRERIADVGLLLGAILRAANVETTTFSASVCRSLLAHTWPGNVRELAATVNRALALAGDAPISSVHLPAYLTTAQPEPVPPAPVQAPDGLDATERAQFEALRDQLVAHRGNVSAVARSLGKDRKQIHRWLRRFGLRAETFS